MCSRCNTSGMRGWTEHKTPTEAPIAGGTAPGGLGQGGVSQVFTPWRLSGAASQTPCASGRVGNNL